MRCASPVASASASLPSSQKERGGAGRRRRRRSGGFVPAGGKEAWAGWGGGGRAGVKPGVTYTRKFLFWWWSPRGGRGRGRDRRGGAGAGDDALALAWPCLGGGGMDSASSNGKTKRGVVRGAAARVEGELAGRTRRAARRCTLSWEWPLRSPAHRLFT